MAAAAVPVSMLVTYLPRVQTLRFASVHHGRCQRNSATRKAASAASRPLFHCATQDSLPIWIHAAHRRPAATCAQTRIAKLLADRQYIARVEFLQRFDIKCGSGKPRQCPSPVQTVSWFRGGKTAVTFHLKRVLAWTKQLARSRTHARWVVTKYNYTVYQKTSPFIFWIIRRKMNRF